jgi:hypothetical protein
MRDFTDLADEQIGNCFFKQLNPCGVALRVALSHQREILCFLFAIAVNRCYLVIQ